MVSKDFFCEFGKITRFEIFVRKVKRICILWLYKEGHYVFSCTDFRLLIRVTLVLWIMEGTTFSGSLCDFLSYIKKNEGTVASNWPRQISSELSQIIMHVGGLKNVGQWGWIVRYSVTWQLVRVTWSIGNFWDCSSKLKMEAANSTEALVSIYQTKWFNTPE
jgi:hypothetical protein